MQLGSFDEPGRSVEQSSDRAVETARGEPGDDGPRSRRRRTEGRGVDTAVTTLVPPVPTCARPASRSRSAGHGISGFATAPVATSTSRANRSTRRTPARARSRSGMMGEYRSGKRQTAVRSPVSRPRVRKRTVPGAEGNSAVRWLARACSPASSPRAFAEHESGTIHEEMGALQALRCREHEGQRRVLVAVDDVVGQGGAQRAAPRVGSRTRRERCDGRTGARASPCRDGWRSRSTESTEPRRDRVARSPRPQSCRKSDAVSSPARPKFSTIA